MLKDSMNTEKPSEKVNVKRFKYMFLFLKIIIEWIFSVRFLGCSACRCGLPWLDRSCCNWSKCDYGQGDCDKDSHCRKPYVCGKNNCRELNRMAHRNYDCCTGK